MTDYLVGDTIYGMFTTRALTGIPTVLAGSPVAQIYENDSATQITAGITLGVSHDSIVGMNLLTIVATGANGYEAGKDYNVMLSAGTVSSVSVVGEVVWSFSLGREAAAQDLANGTDGLGAIKAETAAIVADTGTDGVVLAADAITAAKIADNAITSDQFAQSAADLVWGTTARILTASTNFNDVSTAEVNTQVDLALTDIHLDHLMAAAAADVVVDGSVIAHMVSTTEDWSTFVPSTDALQAIRDRGDSAWVTGAGTDSAATEAKQDTMQTAIDALPSAADVNTQVDAAWTTQMADSVSTDGTIATREQALYMIVQLLTEFAITTTTVQVKKVDGSTSLFALTLDDATTPTSATRA